MNAGELMLRHARGLALLAVLACGAGLAAYVSLPRGLYPELSFPRISVVAQLPDASTDVLLLNVTRPLEEALVGVLGVQRVRSKTLRGAVELSLLFDGDEDMVIALQLVQSRLAEVRADLPLGTKLIADRVTPASFPILTVNVDGNAPPTMLRDVALYQVRPALSRVAGVGPVTVTAGEAREIEVEIDPARAEAAGLTLAQIAQRLDAANRIATIGRLDASYRRYAVVLSGLARNLHALGDVVVGGDARAPIRLADVAQIGEKAADAQLLVRSGQGPAAVVNVARRIGGDVVALDRGLRAALVKLRAELPAGISLTPVYEQATLVDAATLAVRDEILLGAVLASLVLLWFLRSARAALLAALTIPSSLLIACAAMRLVGGSLNLMSLGGMAIAVGLVIDDAVVFLEAIHRELEAGNSPHEAAARAIRSLGGPVVSTTLTTIVVFAPLAWLPGVAGAFFSSLAIALSAAVLASLLIALTVVPPIAARILRIAKAPREAGGERYAALLGRALLRPWPVLLGAALLVAIGAGLGTIVHSGFLPELDEGAYVIDYFSPIGTALPQADALAQHIDTMLRADPDVVAFTRRLGAELGPPAATEASRGDVIVRLSPDRRRGVEEIMEAHRQVLSQIAPGLRVELLQLLQDMLGDLEGNPEPIEIKLFGDDEVVLHRAATQVAAAIKDVPGLVDLFDGQLACSPERLLVIDPVAAGRIELSAQQIADQLGAALLGRAVAPMPDRDRLLPVRVRWPDAVRFDRDALLRMRLHTNSGGWVPLSEVVKIADGCPPAERMRESLRMMVSVTARLDGSDLGSAAHEIEKRLAALRLPPGCSYEVGGQREAQARSFRALARALAAAAALVLVVMVFQFGGFAAPLAILSATPLALAGGVAALVVTGTALNVSSFLGAILLIGLVVKNGILLLQHAHRREEAGDSIDAALEDAARARLRPILMTTLCTLLGLIPLALAHSSGAELHRPLAITVLGGLVLSTLGTLFIVPVLYAALRRARPRRHS